ncbi:MAG: iron ABC transporter permease [Candidatus Hydrogenedentota bacterium]
MFVLASPAIALSVIPVAMLIARAFTDRTGHSALFTAHALGTLTNTVYLAILASIGAAVLGCIAGFAMGTSEWRGRAVFRTLLLIPLALPPYLHGIGWTTLLRPNGLLATSLTSLCGVRPSMPSETLQSIPGAAMILAFAYFPLIALFTEKSLALVPRSFSETARVFGAGGFSIFRHAYWPAVRPAIFAGAALTAIMTASESGVPTLLKVRVFSFEVLTQLAAFNDVAAATILMFPLLLLGLLVLTILPAFIRADPADHGTGEFLPFPMVSRRGWWTRATLTAALLCISTLCPFSTVWLSGLAPDAWSAMAPLAAGPALQSIFHAVLAAALAIAFAIGFGVCLRDTLGMRRTGIEFLLLVGFVIPSAILGLSLLELYGKPPWSEWIGGQALVTGALFVRFQIVAYYAITSSMRQIPSELYEAAELDGAGFWARILFIDLPILRTPVLITTVCLFILCMGDIGIIMLLHPPGGETLLLALFSIEANSPRSYVAVLTLLAAALVIGPILIAAVAITISRETRLPDPQHLNRP